MTTNWLPICHGYGLGQDSDYSGDDAQPIREEGTFRGIHPSFAPNLQATNPFSSYLLLYPSLQPPRCSINCYGSH